MSVLTLGRIAVYVPNMVNNNRPYYFNNIIITISKVKVTEKKNEQNMSVRPMHS